MTVPQFAMLLIAIVAQTGALFYWGGRMSQLIKSHDKEIAGLRDWKHNEAQRDFTDLKIRMGILEEGRP